MGLFFFTFNKSEKLGMFIWIRTNGYNFRCTTGLGIATNLYFLHNCTDWVGYTKTYTVGQERTPLPQSVNHYHNLCNIAIYFSCRLNFNMVNFSQSLLTFKIINETFTCYK